MDRRSIFSKSAKGLMEATGKTSLLARDLRNILKQIDGKLTIADLAFKLDSMPESKLMEAMKTLEEQGFVRELIARTGANPATWQAVSVPASGKDELDFTSLVSRDSPRPDSVPPRQQAETKYHSDVRARAEAAAKARLDAEARVRAEVAARTKAEAEAKARREAEAKAHAEAEAKARREAEERERKQALDKARQEAEERARREAEQLRQKLEQERRARELAERKAQEHAQRLAEQRAQREAEERARREAEERRRAREEAERKAKEEAERKAKEEAERAQREAEELRRKLEEERRAREEAERKAKEEAERARREAEEQARREAEELRRKLEEERAQKEAEERARVEAEELRLRLEAERRVREEAERKIREEAERLREESERRAKEEAERAAREAEERAQKEAEERARVEAEELRLRLEAERRAREEAEARAQAEERLRQEEEKLRLERELEQEAQREAERALESARRDEEESARREAEEQTAKEAQAREERQRREREERENAEREQERLARLAEEERAREDEKEHLQQAREKEALARAAEAESRQRAKKDAEEAALARKEARLRERAEKEAEKVAKDKAAQALERAARSSRGRRNWGRPIALTLIVLLVGALIAVHVMPLDASKFEKAAQSRFGQPVRIASVRLALFPLPQLRLEHVTIGSGAAAKVALVRANPELSSLWEDNQAFKTVELEGAELSQEWVPAVLWGRGNGKALRIDRVIAKSLKVQAQGFELPPLDVDLRLDAAGELRSASISDGERKTSVKIAADRGNRSIEIMSTPFKLPFGKNVQFEEFTGHGTLLPSELSLPEFEAKALGGRVSGNARLRWSSDWSLEGELAARDLDVKRIAGPLVYEGRLDGKGAYAMRAASPEKLEESLRLEGAFKVRKGAIGTVDFTRVLQGSSAPGGNTLFSEMSGNATMTTAGVQLHQLRLTAGLLGASGEASIDAQKKLNGRLQLELRSSTAQARASIALTGTLPAPLFRR